MWILDFDLLQSIIVATSVVPSELEWISVTLLFLILYYYILIYYIQRLRQIPCTFYAMIVYVYIELNKMKAYCRQSLFTIKRLYDRHLKLLLDISLLIFKGHRSY